MKTSSLHGRTREDRLLYACSNQRPDSHQAEQIRELLCNTIDWEYILFISRCHAVSPLILNSIANVCGDSGCPMPIPDAVASCFKEDAVRNAAEKIRRSEGLRRLLGLCNARGIDVMLIKGAALDALVYDEPWYTTSSDVDLVIKQGIHELDPRDRTLVASLCIEYRFECDSFRHEDFLTLSRENYEFLWRNARKLRCAVGEALFLSEEDLLITSCLNACKHKFFRLKNIVDIAEIVRGCPEMRWEVVAQNSRILCCTNIVYAALLVARRTVGLDRPAVDLARTLGVHPLRAAIIEFTVERLLKLRLSTLGRRFTLLKKVFSISVVLPYACYRGSQVGRRFWLGITGRGDVFERF